LCRLYVFLDISSEEASDKDSGEVKGWLLEGALISLKAIIVDDNIGSFVREGIVADDGGDVFIVARME